jgi:hypothetical protein
MLPPVRFDKYSLCRTLHVKPGCLLRQTRTNSIFERKILRKIYGPTQNPDGTWRIKTNDELRHRMKQEDITKFIKSQRLRWAAHLMRMENTRTTRKITEWAPYKTRPVGRPRLRWMDQVEEDLKRMKIVGWKAKEEDRQEWNRTVEQTKTHPGL